VSAKKEGQPRAKVDRQEKTPDPEQPQSEPVAKAEEVSKSAEDVIDDIDDLLDAVDQSLIAMLFEPGEAVDPAKLEERAETMVREFQQKGGQ